MLHVVQPTGSHKPLLVTRGHSCMLHVCEVEVCVEGIQHYNCASWAVKTDEHVDENFDV